MRYRIFSRIKFHPKGTGEPTTAGRLPRAPRMKAAAVRWLPSQLPSWTSPRAELPTAPTPQPGGATRFKFEVFATLTLFNQNKWHRSPSLPMGRRNSSWREEERETFGFESLLGCFTRGGTAVVACCCPGADQQALQLRAGFQRKGPISKQSPLHPQT